MIIYIDNRFDTIRFGFEALKEAFAKTGTWIIERKLSSFQYNCKEKAIIASIESLGVRMHMPELKDSGFDILTENNKIYVTGKDSIGVMYGLLDLAETIELFGMDAVKSKTENPCLQMRGIKFNLPFEPYDNGDPFEKNIETCKDIHFWRQYIDFLARNRYNCLSLWSEHPFHMMFRLEKYPGACPYSDVELEKYKDLYKFIFSHARSRGIDVYLITWNIRITPFVAKGLGLPEELGDMSDSYAGGNPNLHKKFLSGQFDGIRQHLDIIKDYFKECIKTLLMTYKDLKGIGTSCGEEMVGKNIDRQKWVSEVYLEAVKESGRHVPFIHRTNASNIKVTKELFIDKYPGDEKYISFKYANAHMYSHPHPQFDKSAGVWDNVEYDNFKLIYTVRNDDFHTLRWGDPEFIREYARGMNKPNVHGFYWGADGYIWADDFQHAPHKHMTWKYDFERHWYEFELLGRLSYNPEIDEKVWLAKFEKRYGKLVGEKMFYAMKSVSRILPAINRLFWINYDFEWHPESLLSLDGFKSILDFVHGKPMPGVGVTGMREYVHSKLNNLPSEGETPEHILSVLKASITEADKLVSEVKSAISGEYMDGDIVCTLLDIEAWRELGRYYFCKINAALKLICFEAAGEKAFKDEAVDYLREALKAWKLLAEIGSSHYMPYRMARTKQIFGWSYYTDEVEKDIEIATGYMR